MRRLPFLLLIALLSACDSTSSDSDDLGIIGGVDLDALFAAPTQQEIVSARAAWTGRDVSVRGYNLELTVERQLARRDVRIQIVSHLVTGQRHYGAVIVPAGAQPGTLPVMMYLHGGDNGVSVDSEVGFVMEFFADLRDDFIYVVPSFRDEPLRFGGQTWNSEGPASPWNYDVDDAIALLNVAIQTVPEADGQRVVNFGFSRGGGVAMLMAIRDARVDRVVDFFGPTDFFGPFVQEVAIEALNGQPRNLPGLDYMNNTYLTPLRDGTLTPADLRPELIRRSPVLFAADLPRMQMHHGKADTVVPVSQAQSLIEAMNRAGKSAPDFEGYLYDGGEHNPITLPGAFDRTNEMLRSFLGQ